MSGWRLVSTACVVLAVTWPTRTQANPSAGEGVDNGPDTFRELRVRRTITVSEEITGYDRHPGAYFDPGDLARRPNVMSRNLMSMEVVPNHALGSLHIRDTVALTDEYPRQESIPVMENFLQEAYLELRPTSSLYVHIGKENYLSGVSYSWNPTDYFDNQGSRIYGPEWTGHFRRPLRPGAYMVSLEQFVPAMTVRAIYAPQIPSPLQEFQGNAFDKLYAKAALNLLSDFNPEGTFFLKNGKYPGYGAACTGSLTRQLVVQFEASINYGSDAVTISDGTPIGPPGAVVRTFEFVPRSPGYYAQGVLGANYMLPWDVDAIAEYYFNEQGLSGAELTSYSSRLGYSAARAADPAFDGPTGQNLYWGYIGQAASRFEASQTARHYAMLHLERDRLGSDKLDCEVNTIANLQDGGVLVNPRAEYRVDSHIVVRASAYIILGKNQSEFGWIPERFMETTTLAVQF